MIATMLSNSANLRPRHDRMPPLNGRNASRGQSPRNRDGLNRYGSAQYFATVGIVGGSVVGMLAGGQGRKDWDVRL